MQGMLDAAVEEERQLADRVDTIGAHALSPMSRCSEAMGRGSVRELLNDEAARALAHEQEALEGQ